MKTFTVTDADADKLAEIMKDCLPVAYYAELATAVLGQLGQLPESLRAVRRELEVDFDGSPGDARRAQWRGV